jgi:hypothetical protein
MFTEIKKRGLRKYKQYKLCYIERVDEMIIDYTPFSKRFMAEDQLYLEWVKKDKERQKFELKEYGCTRIVSSPYSSFIQTQEYKNPELRKGNYIAYFTPISLDKQWGDDWDDAPYQHNSGLPYDYTYNENKERVEVEILKLYFRIDEREGVYVNFPNDSLFNSNYCVQDINRCVAPWIYLTGKDDKYVVVHAGINPKQFIDKINEINNL